MSMRRTSKLMPALASMQSLRDNFRHIVRMLCSGDSGDSCAPMFEYTPLKVTPSQIQVQDASFNGNQNTLNPLMQAYACGNIRKAVACMSEHIVLDISGPSMFLMGRLIRAASRAAKRGKSHSLCIRLRPVAIILPVAHAFYR